MYDLKRNPILTFEGYTFKFIGDTHFGKRFVRGVPAKHLGFRELNMVREFAAHLKEGDQCDFIVIVGDLFDSVRVSNETLYEIYKVLQFFLKRKTVKAKLIIIPGNHDLAKDKGKVSSYFILKTLLENKFKDHPLFTMVFKESLLISLDNLHIYLDAYDPLYEHTSLRGEALVKSISDDTPLLSIGHWDDTRFDTGYTPSDAIVNRSSYLVSGHVHVPSYYTVNDCSFMYVGSMQPYGFGEDPEGLIYRVYHYSEMDELLRDPQKLKEENLEHTFIRVDCYPGYSIDYGFGYRALLFNPIYDPPMKKEVSDDTKNGLDLSDFNSIFLYTLKTEYDMEDDVLTSLDRFLRGDEEEFKLSDELGDIFYE